MSDVAIRVENLSKRYRLGVQEERHDTLVGAALAFAKRPSRNLQRLRRLTRFSANDADEQDVLWALRDVSFEVKQGEVVGIIGRNGAGKSTLLKILSRITYPTTGRVELRGRVSSLLEVGTGFHPELTGRENVYLNGTILGMRKKEIDRKFDEIVDFSGVEKFIDTPVKHYSSGMRVRLAFSVAAHLDPEVLLVDEVLAVGDVEFQKKCLGKLGDVAREGRTVLFVSHNMNAILRLCQSAILFRGGELVLNGFVDYVIDKYLSFSGTSVSFWQRNPRLVDDLPVQILTASVLNHDDEISGVINYDEPIYIQVKYQVKKTLMASWELAIQVIDGTGLTIFVSSNGDEIVSKNDMKPGVYKATCQIPSKFLRPGRYTLSLFTHIPRVQVFESLENLLSVEISHGGYLNRDRNIGVITPIFPWYLESI